MGTLSKREDWGVCPWWGVMVWGCSEGQGRDGVSTKGRKSGTWRPRK